jgi:ATP-dependent Lon protease
METFEQKALDYFGALTINKSFARKAGFGSRAIPVYVREWIVSHYVKDAPDLEEDAREKIADFVHKYAPDKSEREAVKNKLFEMQDVKILDDYSVQVNLAKGDRYLIVPFLDETKGGVPPHIVRDNEMLLTSGIWGVATLSYSPPSDGTIGQIIMRDFLPFQLSNLNLDYFISARQQFSTSEWLDFIVNSMGFNHHIYTERQKILLVSRMLPMVESRYNLIELAPKGTGKSFVFENLSRYVSVRSGAISAPVLFYNDARKTPGLITRYDCVVIDEAQKVRGDSSGELTALLKSYLESGRFGRGSAGSITSESGLVMLANIELDEHHRPSHESIGLMRAFPNFLRETAFLDRFSGLLPGWDLPRVTKDTPSTAIALKGDIFGEILHMVRNDISYRDYVKTNMELQNCDDMRDSRAVEAGASGFLKILFPNKQPSEQDFYKYCVNPAIELRQRVRDELCKLDREYAPVTFSSKYPDAFQRHHRPARYIDLEKIDQLIPVETESNAESIESVDQEETELLEFFGATQSTTDNEPVLASKTVHIKEGDTGYSYQNLFGPYIKGARKIYITDPYVRLDYQIRNFMALASILDTSFGEISLHLTTSSEDSYQEDVVSKKLTELSDNLATHGVILTFEFSSTAHDRVINLDNGWRIYPGRGLDIFQKADSKFELSEIDQTKKKCRETQIIYVKAE